ncbi:DNA-binding transcriptional regulator, LysR family [Ensifer sp. YR511]|nr:DNA-binding transcriptional regulator, LysR family [Ensifer sp. YR511]
MQATEIAPWVFREAFGILSAEWFAANYARYGKAPLRTVLLRLDQCLAGGKLSHAVAHSIRAVATVVPEVFFVVEWTGGQPKPRPKDISQANIVIQNSVEIYYADRDGPTCHSNLSQVIGSDTLVLLGPTPLAPVSITAQETFRVHDIPGLSSRYLAKKLNRRSDINHARPLGQGILESLNQFQTDVFCPPIIVPAEYLAGRFLHSRASAKDLTPPVDLDIIATTNLDDPACKMFVSKLKEALSSDKLSSTPPPSVTARQLTYFRLLNENGSIKASASIAGIAPTAITAQLSDLQKRIDAPLLERRANGLQLTEAGRRFSDAAELIHHSHRKLVLHRPRGINIRKGRVELGILPAVGPNSFLISKVAQAVEAWRQFFPDQQLRISEEPNDALRARIRRGSLHLAIVAIKSRDLPRFDVGSWEKLALVYRRDSGLARPELPLNYDDLSFIPLVLPTRRFGLRQLVEAAGLGRKTFLHPVVEVESLSMCIAMVRTGKLATILPPSDVEGEAGDLCSSIIENPSIVRNIQVIYSSDRQLTIEERELVALLKHHLRG